MSSASVFQMPEHCRNTGTLNLQVLPGTPKTTESVRSLTEYCRNTGTCFVFKMFRAKIQCSKTAFPKGADFRNTELWGMSCK